MEHPQIEMRPVDALKPYAANARTHSKKQVKQLASSIRRFGFTNPILIDSEDGIVAGHGRVLAAREMGMVDVPTLRLSHLTSAERRAYVLADNKLALNAGWDRELLAKELQGLIDLDFEVELTGFSLAEIDFTLDSAKNADPAACVGPEDDLPPASPVAVTGHGDVWQLGRHRLICGDARPAEDYQTLLGGDAVDLIFTDPPYNVKIDGHVSGLGKVKHREFAMAAGEMSRQDCTAFLELTLRHGAAHCADGAIAFVCMDWRHMAEVLEAGAAAFTELKNLCVWNKTNAGMGTFYRSKHELIFVFKVGSSPHVNSFGLGDTGRYRTNVWDYAGVNSVGSARAEELNMHPTVKPVQLVADAIRDCSRRGAIVLDMFGGSGSTLIAAEMCGRAAHLIEYDPLYCDTIVRRFEQYTGKKATLMGSGESFEDVGLVRAPMTEAAE